MTIQLEDITPDIAKHMLSGNSDNRPCRVRHVKFLADQMKAGSWQVTGDPIKLSVSGRLLDGQHRLRAILQSNTTQPVYVARGCEESIFSVLDTGRNRTSADVLATAGIKNSSTTAAAAKILLLYENGTIGILNRSGRRETTNTAILDFANAHELDNSITKAQAWTKRCKLIKPAEFAALHYLFCKKNATQAFDFLQQITTGLNLTEGHPVLLLRQKLQLARDGRFNFSTAERLALTIKAWNSYRENKKLGQLTWREYEGFPAIL